MNIENARRISNWWNGVREAQVTWLAEQAAKHYDIVEIGAWLGCTTRAMADNTSGKVLTVDTWLGGTEPCWKEVFKDKPKDWAYDIFKENTKDLTNLEALRMTSLEAAKYLAGRQFDMIFIDASHDYDSVKADILAWSPLVAPDGLLCGDDYCATFPGLMKAVDELLPRALKTAGCYWYQGKTVFNHKTALILICTGEKYWKYIPIAVGTAKKYFPADILLFTDDPTNHGVAKQVYCQHEGWPNVTLHRYKMMLTQREWLSQYDYMYYMDVDSEIVNPITDDIYADGIVVTLCPHYVGTSGTPDTNPASTAYLPHHRVKQYVGGSFQGGRTKEYLEMCEVLDRNIDADAARGVLAIWHDESHLNRYVADHPPAKVLSTEYRCPRPQARSEKTFILSYAKPGFPSLPGMGRVEAGIL